MPSSPTPRLPLAGLALAAVGGILLAEHLALPPLALLTVASAGLLLAPWHRGTIPLWLATAAIFALAHTWQWRENPARAWAASVAGEPGIVTGVLAGEPEPLNRGMWRARMKVETWHVRGETVTLGATVLARWAAAEHPRYGDRWQIEGALDFPPPARNPGAFDAAGWFARQGIFLEVRSRDPSASRLLARDTGSAVKAAALGTRAWIMHTLGIGLENDGETCAVIAGITLGAREDGADAYLPAFRQTGTLHLFAVSGLHVGMFGLLLWLVLRPLGFSRRQAILIIVPMLFFYALVTGAKPSSLRAATMISIALGGFLIDRPAAPGNSLAAAALVLLGFDTNQLFLPGFQLSFCVVASIILLAPVFDSFLARHLRPDPFLPRKLYTAWQRRGATCGRATAAMLGVSTAAWLGSLPLTIGLFHLVPLVAVPANVLAVPLAFAVLSVSMLSLLGGLASPWIAAVFNQTNWALTGILLAAVQWAAALPGAWLPMPPGWMQPPARLTVFDLSTGGAQLLRTPHSAWLIDAGADYDFRHVIEPALRAAGTARLEGLILTHGDSEHVGGAEVALRTAPPQRIMDSALRDRSPVRRSLHAVLQSEGRPKALLFPDDEIAVGRSVRLRVLAPSRQARTADDQVVVLEVEAFGFRVLLMSDAGAAIEDELLRGNVGLRPCDAVVFGRHGGDLFATSAFLDAVAPRVIVLAPPDPFRAGTGEAALRARLENSGATLFDQQDCGAAIMTFRPGSLRIEGFLDGQRAELAPGSETRAPVRHP